MVFDQVRATLRACKLTTLCSITRMGSGHNVFRYSFSFEVCLALGHSRCIQKQLIVVISHYDEQYDDLQTPHSYTNGSVPRVLRNSYVPTPTPI